jgi:hypothetical protein
VRLWPANAAMMQPINKITALMRLDALATDILIAHGKQPD